jgi:hypothetical protein
LANSLNYSALPKELTDAHTTAEIKFDADKGMVEKTKKSPGTYAGGLQVVFYLCE